MTEDFFHDQMARLVGLKFVPADMTTHWQALHDLPEAVLIGAVSRAGRSRVDFPTPYELRQDADLDRTLTLSEEPDRTVALAAPYAVTVPHAHAPIQVTHEWSYYCEDCRDVGWRSFWCGPAPEQKSWAVLRSCPTFRQHGSHEWVAHCGCYDMNPALLRKRAAQKQYAARETARGHR